jgi:hypothetical protein
MANACGPGCGYCGRCTDRLDWPGGDDKPSHLCARDGCDRTFNMFSVSIAGLGTFCSRHCATIAEAQFTERMKRRGFMDVQPDLLTQKVSGE